MPTPNRTERTEREPPAIYREVHYIRGRMFQNLRDLPGIILILAWSIGFAFCALVIYALTLVGVSS